jgi:hypothetical protein
MMLLMIAAECLNGRCSLNRHAGGPFSKLNVLYCPFRVLTPRMPADRLKRFAGVGPHGIASLEFGGSSESFLQSQGALQSTSD